MEHQANKYATYILMPKQFVVKLFKEKHKELFTNKHRLSKLCPKRTRRLIGSIAEELKVSKKAIAYRLRDLELISEDVFCSLNLKRRWWLK